MNWTTSETGELDDWAAVTAKYTRSEYNDKTADSTMQRLQDVENAVHSLQVSLRGAEQTGKDSTARIQQLEDLAAKLEQRAFKLEQSLKSKAAHAPEHKDTTTSARKRLVDASMAGLAAKVNNVERATQVGAERLQLLEMRCSNTEGTVKNMSGTSSMPVVPTPDVIQVQTEAVEERIHTLEDATVGAMRQLDDIQGLLDGKAGMDAIQQVMVVVDGLSACLDASEKNKGVGTGIMASLKNLQCPLDSDHGTMLHASNRGLLNEQDLQTLTDRLEQLEEAFCGTERQLKELQQGTSGDGGRPSRPPQVGRFNGVVLELEHQLAETRSRDSEQRVEVDAVQGELRQLSRDLNGLHLRFSVMQEALHGKADTSCLEHLTAGLQSMGNSRIESAELKDHMLVFESSLTSLRRQIGTVEGAMKQKADTQSLELLKAAIEELMAELPAQDHSMDHALTGRLRVLEGTLMSIQGKVSATEARFGTLENIVQEKAGAILVQELQQGVQEVFEQLERARAPVSAAPELSGRFREADGRIDLALRRLQDMVSTLEANMVGQQFHVDGSSKQQQLLEETVMAMQVQLCDVDRFLQERIGLEPVQSLKSMLLIFQTQMSSLEQHSQGPAAIMQLQQLRNQISTLEMQLAGVRSASAMQQQHGALPRSQQQLHTGDKDLHHEVSGLQNKVSGLERAIWEKIYGIDQMVQADAQRVHGLEGALLNVSTQMVAMQRSTSTWDSFLSSSLPSQPPVGLEDDHEWRCRTCSWQQ